MVQYSLRVQYMGGVRTRATFLCRLFHCRCVVCACSAGAVGSFSNKPLSPKKSQCSSVLSSGVLIGVHRRPPRPPMQHPRRPGTDWRARSAADPGCCIPMTSHARSTTSTSLMGGSARPAWRSSVCRQEQSEGSSTACPGGRLGLGLRLGQRLGMGLRLGLGLGLGLGFGLGLRVRQG